MRKVSIIAALTTVLLAATSPASARFLQTDPIGYKDDANLYAYARNDPANMVDPSGNCSFDSGIMGMIRCIINGFQAPPPPPPPPAPPDPQQVESEKKALVAAQDAARANPDFQPEAGGTTHCNQSTCAIATAVGAPTGDLTNAQGDPLKANAMASNLSTSKEYREVTKEEAQTLANEGKLVIAAYENDSGPGHVATVRPEGVEGDNPTNAKGPLINNVGVSVGVMGENYSFGKKDVHYYTPR